MKIIRKILLVLIGLVFTTTSIFYAALIMLHSTLIKPYETTKLLDESGLYGGIKNEIVSETDRLADTIQFTGMDMVKQQVDVQQMVKDTVNDVVTEEWMRTQVSFMEKELWDYVLGKDKELAPLDMSPLQDAFIQEVKQKIAQEETKNPMLKALQLSSMVDQLPGKVDLQVDWAKQAGITTDQLDDIAHYYQLFDQAMSVLVIIMVAVFLLGLLISGSLKTYVHWIGVNGMFIGVGLMLPYVVSFFYPVKTTSQYAENIVSYVMDQALLPLCSTGFVIVAISVVLLVVGKQLKKKQSKQRIGY